MAKSLALSKTDKQNNTITTTKKSLITNLIHSSWKIKLIVFLLLIGLGLGIKYLFFQTKSVVPIYETSLVSRDTLITTISGSGTITSGNYTDITTKISGVVTKVYVTNGDQVSKGQKIAEVTLDDYAQERQSAAWVAYLEAKENYLSAVSAKSEADIAMWEAQQDVIDAQEAYDDMMGGGDNPETHEAYTESDRAIIIKRLPQKREAFSAQEAKYKNADADITNASAKVAKAYREYQENSATIFAPASGEITNLALAEGITVSASSTTSSTSGATIVSAQTVGKVNDLGGQLIATIPFSEIDIVNIKADQKVNLTLDAYSDKSFTGKVLAVNTSGSVSSGVTSYPVTILLDSTETNIYPNMALSVEIITAIKTDVLLVPSTAIQTVGETSYVQVKKNGEINSVQVEVGSANDSQTEIVSGLAEGDEVVISTITNSATSTSTNSSSSPFSGSSRGMMGGPPGGF